MAELKVVPISKANPNGENVIERLEEALEMARNGGINNCIVIMDMSKGEIIDGWANNNNPFVMVGALESVKREFMDACMAHR